MQTVSFEADKTAPSSLVRLSAGQNTNPQILWGLFGGLRGALGEIGEAGMPVAAHLVRGSLVMP